jgi:hypothetical protein
MIKFIKKIVGAKIKEVKEVHDYWQIVTDRGIISIYNACSFQIEGRSFGLNELDKHEIGNNLIIACEIKENEYLRFNVDDRYIIEVSLLDEAYIGPEAVAVNFNSGETMVIN